MKQFSINFSLKFWRVRVRIRVLIAFAVSRKTSQYLVLDSMDILF